MSQLTYHLPEAAILNYRAQESCLFCPVLSPMVSTRISHRNHYRIIKKKKRETILVVYMYIFELLLLFCRSHRSIRLFLNIFLEFSKDPSWEKYVVIDSFKFSFVYIAKIVMT